MERLAKKALISLVTLCLLTGIVYASADIDVAVVRSDWKAFDKPVPADKVLSKEEIEVVVRKAINELGGMSRFVKPEHKWVVIKPNIVEIAGTGSITDAKVVWAIAKIVHETNPKVRISIAEGPADWISPGHPEAMGIRQEIDGFAATGYRAILDDPFFKGGKIDTIDLNFDEVVEVKPPFQNVIKTF